LASANHQRLRTNISPLGARVSRGRADSNIHNEVSQ